MKTKMGEEYMVNLSLVNKNLKEILLTATPSFESTVNQIDISHQMALATAYSI